MHAEGEVDCGARDNAPPSKSKARKLATGDQLVDEVVRQAERFGDLGDGENQPFGHVDNPVSVVIKESMVIPHYW